MTFCAYDRSQRPICLHHNNRTLRKQWACTYNLLICIYILEMRTFVLVHVVERLSSWGLSYSVIWVTWLTFRIKTSRTLQSKVGVITWLLRISYKLADEKQTDVGPRQHQVLCYCRSWPCLRGISCWAYSIASVTNLGSCFLCNVGFLCNRFGGRHPSVFIDNLETALAYSVKIL